MANTKTLTGSGLRGYTIEFYLSEDSTSIENNTSTISYSLKIKSNNYSYADYGTGYSIYINGTRVAYLADNGMDTSLSAHSSLTLKTGTTTVTHNNDGTKTVSLSASVSMPEGSYGPGDMSCSGTWDLTTIPRASTMTLPSSFTINSSGSITIQMASNTFSHTITYSGLGLSGTVATLNAGVSSASWTPTTSFYQKLPNSTSGTVTLTLTTKSGSTTIGTKSYDTTIVVPTSIKPTAPSLTLSPVNTNAWINTKGLYVGGYSKVRVQSSASPGSGASVSSYSISGAFSGTGADFTSSVLSAGSKSITVTVTDSRGRSNSATTSVTFLSYTYPGLTTFTALRGTYSGGSWTTNVNGNHIRVEAVPSVALSANGNTASVTVKIGNTNPSATSGNYYYFTSTNATTSYTITGSVTDSVGNSTSRSLTVPTIEVPLNINVDTPGIGVGMIAQNTREMEVAPSWSLVANGKHNKFNYLPYSWYATGGSTAGWSRIATITIIDTQADAPIEFLVQRRHDGVSVKLSIMFAGGNTTDPTLESFYYDDISGTRSTRLFQAFIYKTGTSTWDVYVYDSTTYCSIGVYALLSRYAQLEANITYTNASLSSIPASAVMATQLPIVNTATYNTISYLPYSFNATGTSNTQGYARVATVTITGSTWTQTTILFKGFRRTDGTPFNLYFALSGAASDPPLGAFWADFPSVYSTPVAFEAFTYKTAANTWDIYVRKCSGTDQITVWAYVPKYAQDNYVVTYSQAHLSSVPAGATMATHAPCFNPTVTLTKSSGSSTASTVRFYRDGNVCFLSFALATTALINPGSNMWVGTHNGPVPVQPTEGVSYYGASGIITNVNGSNITVRLIADSLASGSNCYCNVVYLTNA